MTPIDVDPLDICFIEIPVVGATPLLQNRCNLPDLEKTKHTKKDLEQQFRDSLHHHPDGGYGIPAVAAKRSMVDACRTLNLKMTEIKQYFFVEGPMLKIEGSEPRMRVDAVSANTKGRSGAMILIARAEFIEWETVVPIRYNANAITPKTLVSLLEAAGFGVGWGPYRPQNGGMFGMFHVKMMAEADEFATNGVHEEPMPVG